MLRQGVQDCTVQYSTVQYYRIVLRLLSSSSKSKPQSKLVFEKMRSLSLTRRTIPWSTVSLTRMTFQRYRCRYRSDAMVDGMVDAMVDAIVDATVDAIVDEMVDAMVDAVVD